MASYSETIDLRITGDAEQKAKVIEKRISKIKSIAKSLKPVPNLFDKRGNDGIVKAKEELKKLVEQYGKGTGSGNRFSNTIAGLNSQLNAFKQVLGNVNIGSDEFVQSLTASEKISRRLARAEAERLSVLNKINTANTVGRAGSVKETLDLGKVIPKSIAGLEFYQQQLQDTLRTVNIGSSDYRELAISIGTVNEQLAIAQGRGSIQGPKLPPGFNEKGRISSGGAGGGRRGGRFQDIATGAGFPLLFGGGPIQALAGGIGGAAGGLGGSIAASAVSAQIEAFVGSAAELGNALSKANPNIDVLIEAIGGLNNGTGERIKLLEELEGKEAARLAVEKELADLIGGDGVNALKEFGADSVELSNELSRFFTLVKVGMAELINSAGLFKGIAGEIERSRLLKQAQRNQDDPELAALKEESKNVQRHFNPNALAEDEEIMNRMVHRMRQLNAEKNVGEFERLKALREQLEAQEKQRELDKEQRELDKAAKQILDEKIQKHKIIQGEIHAQTALLEGQVKIFNLQAQAAQSVFAVTQARNNSELSALKLEESRLQRQLANLQRIDKFYGKQRKIINKIADNRKKQAQIEFKIEQQSIKQMVAKAQVQRQLVNFEVQKIDLQILLLRLQAEEIQDTQKKLERLVEINQQSKISAEIAKQMTISADKSLSSAKEIAKFQKLSAQHLLDGKLESIEAERVDARRAVHAASIAKSAKTAATATSSGSSVGSSFGSSVGSSFGSSAGLSLGESVSNSIRSSTTLGPAGRSTGTVSTAGPIDPEVYDKVMSMRPSGGYKHPGLMMEALDKEQAAFDTNYLRGPRGAGATSSSAEGGYTGPINIKTGPVMQQDNETYLTMGQFEEGMRDLSESIARGGRSYGSRQFQGVS